jgi:hypothetical protein
LKVTNPDGHYWASRHLKTPSDTLHPRIWTNLLFRHTWISLMSNFCPCTLSLDIDADVSAHLVWSSHVLCSFDPYPIERGSSTTFYWRYGIYSVMIWDDMDATIRHCHSAYRCWE